MEQLKVEICPDGVTAKTLNPVPKPNMYDFGQQLLWLQAEEKRKVFEIENALTDGWIPSYNNPDNSGCHPNAEPKYIPGSIHTGVVENGKIKII